MAFTPAPAVRHSNPNDMEPMRCRVRIERGAPRLFLTCLESLLAQVKGKPRYWRLDLDPEGGMGRLTGLLQPDEHTATQQGRRGDGKRGLFSWRLPDETMALFTRQGQQAALRVEAVTTMGIEFHLPSETPATA